MKNYIKFVALALLTVLTVTGCEKDNKEPVINSSITGDWHLESSTVAEQADVYMSLGTNGRFVIYQHLSTLGYEKFEGTYSVTATTLTGVYDDGVEWNGVYEYTLSGNGNTLTTVLKGAVSTETSVYARTEIPAELPVLTQSRGEAAELSVRRPL